MFLPLKVKIVLKCKTIFSNDLWENQGNMSRLTSIKSPVT